MILALAALTPELAGARPSKIGPCPDATVLPLPELIGTENVEASVLCLVNRARTRRRLRALRSNPILHNTALGHSTEMRTQQYFSHDSIDGASFVDRIYNSGYVISGRGWLVGENIAWGSFDSIRALVQAWMASPSHREVILSPEFREIGVGVAWGGITPLHPISLVATTDFGWVDRYGVKDRPRS